MVEDAFMDLLLDVEVVGQVPDPRIDDWHLDFEILLQFLQWHGSKILILVVHAIVLAPDLLGLILAILEQVVDVRRLVVPAKYPLLNLEAFVSQLVRAADLFCLIKRAAEADVEAEVLAADQD